MTRIDMAWYDAHPFFYLVDGWEFYRDALSPGEFEGRRPDAHLYLGRYGGFDLGIPPRIPMAAPRTAPCWKRTKSSGTTP